MALDGPTDAERRVFGRCIHMASSLAPMQISRFWTVGLVDFCPVRRAVLRIVPVNGQGSR